MKTKMLSMVCTMYRKLFRSALYSEETVTVTVLKRNNKIKLKSVKKISIISRENKKL